jgi:elongation factor P
VVLAGDLRRGSKVLFKGEPYTVLEFQHVKPGKGGAYMRTKMKNLISGLTHEETFRAEEKLETPDLEYKEMQYLYKQADVYNFIDQETYDQVELTEEQLSDVLDFLKEQSVYTVLYFDGRPIAVTSPLFMELEVRETPPGVRGDTAQGGGTKPATLETGLVLQVPLFVNEGDIIKVDTREAKYIERVDKRK